MIRISKQKRILCVGEAVIDRIYEMGENINSDKYIDYLVTRDLSEMNDNTVAYIIWCNEDGKVIDDGTIFKHSSEHFMLCCAVKILNWLNDSAIGFDVTIIIISDSHKKSMFC